MVNLFVFLALLGGTSEPAPVTQYTASNAAETNDPNKVVCKREEQVGSRLGGKKLCLSIRDWQARQEADRLQTEEVQAGARMRDSFDPQDTIMEAPR